MLTKHCFLALVKDVNFLLIPSAFYIYSSSTKCCPPQEWKQNVLALKVHSIVGLVVESQLVKLATGVQGRWIQLYSWWHPTAS